MTQVNLLPRELKQRQETRRLTILVAAAGAVVVGIVVLLWVLQSMRLSDVNSKLAQQRQVNSRLETEVSNPSLQKAQIQLTQFQARAALLGQTLAGRVAWSGVLRDLSNTLPGGMWLTSLSGSLSSATSTVTTTPVPGSPVIGSIQFSGDSLDTSTLATMLTSLERVHGWSNSWVSEAQQVQINTTTVYSFTGSVDLTRKAAQTGGQL